MADISDSGFQLSIPGAFAGWPHVKVVLEAEDLDHAEQVARLVVCLECLSEVALALGKVRPPPVQVLVVLQRPTLFSPSSCGPVRCVTPSLTLSRM